MNVRKNIPFMVLIIWLILPLLYWQDLRVLIHDNLDGKVVFMLDIVSGNFAFSSPSETVDIIFNGIPRFTIQSEFYIYTWFFKIFEPQLAYYLHYLFIHIVAFIGMELLVKRYSTNKNLNSWFSLSFAVLPFWPSGSLAVAGMPLLFWALSNIYYSVRSFSSWLILVGFNFFSPFFLSSIWLYTILGLILSCLLINKSTRNNSKKLFAPLLLLVLIGICIEYRLFYNLLVLDITPHRIMWDNQNSGLNFFGWVGIAIKLFFLGHYHFHSLNLFISIFSILILIFLIIKKNISFFQIGLLILILFICFSSVIKDFSVFKSILSETPIESLSFRFFSLLPFLWYLLFFSLSVKLISFRTEFKYLILMLIWLQSFLVSFGIYRIDYFGSSFVSNLFFSNLIDRKSSQYSNMDDFYMVKKFQKINKLIPKNTRVACINFHPEIARFNGYKTVGAYLNFIPKDKLIDFNSITKESLDDYCWDSRAYIQIKKSEELNIEKLVNNFSCYYLISKIKLQHETLQQLSQIEDLFIYQISI